MEIRENRELWTLADALEQANKIDLTHEMFIREESKLEGKTEGLIEGIIKGRVEGKTEGLKDGTIRLLCKLIKMKYDVDGLPWLQTLDFEELENVLQLIVASDTFDQVKQLSK